ncbi:MAG: amidohydrolase family protein [Dehalococcoidia bacterium]
MALHLRTTVLPEGVERDVYVDGGRITFEAVAGAEMLQSGGFAIPGLVDAHAHLALASPGGRDLEGRMHASARRHLDAGVLLVRDPGGPGHDVVEFGPEHGLPRVINAGRFLAPRGRYMLGLAREIDAAMLPDAAGEEASRSGAWAKVIGDFFGPDGRITPNFSLEQLRGAAERVHALGARITIHAMSREAIELALEAGFDAIEHGTDMTLDLVEELARRGTTWVPTLLIGDPIRASAAGFGAPPEEVRRWHAAVDALPRAVAHAASLGVRLLAGTDAGMVPHGLVARERDLLIEAGVSAEAALASASWGARAYLGLPGIEEGAPADLVVYDSDPRVDLGALHRPALRILDGVVVS